MKESIESILAIDQMTRELEDQTQKTLDQVQKRYHKDIADLELDRSRQAKKKALEAYEGYLASFDQEMNDLISQQEGKLESMDRAYDRVKKDLLDQCFKDLVEGRQ